MERLNRLINDKRYVKALEKINKDEKNRIYCKHGFQHLLDTARIAYIKALEEKLPYSKEMIYVAALLHDIGKVMQYENGIPHDEASAEIAKELLFDYGFLNEADLILDSILNHRKEDNGNEFNLLIYKSDKLSRGCYSCNATKGCYWSEDKKNLKLEY